MYIPAANRVEDPAKVRAFIHAHGFATLVSRAGDSDWASHLPVLLEESAQGERLLGHMARANEQWRHLATGGEVLCIFHGPHAYVSPSWYAAKLAVPTWNYAAVHVYGIPRLEEDGAFLRKILDDTTSKYESKREMPWRMEFPEDTLSAYMRAIVGFSVKVTRIEAKFKLGQNRSPEDQAGMLAGLENSGDPEGAALAKFIRKQGAGPARSLP
jgi:transcriptional regulator